MSFKSLKNGIAKFFLSSNVYKALVVCVFMLVPAFPLCFVSKEISIVLLLWGAGLLLYDLFHKRNFTKSCGSLALLMICISYIITLLLYAENDIISTLNVFFWTIVEFFILFATDNKRHVSIQNVVDDIYKINIPITIIAFVSGAISFVLFFNKVSIIMIDPESINGFWTFGIAKGRNCGVFNNAIPMANAMFIGAIASMWNGFKAKKLASKLFYVLTFVVCYLAIQTTITRTYIYGLYLVLAVGTFAFVYMRVSDQKKLIVRLGSSLISTALLVGIFFGVTEVSKTVMTSAIANVKPNIVFADSNNSNTSDDSQAADDENDSKNFWELDSQNSLDLERDELNRIPNIFYPRSELWKVGLQVIPHSPIFGFTSGNRISSSIQFGSGSYYDTYLNKTGVATYHNAYFDIAISAGLLVLGIILAFLVMHIVRTLKIILSRKLQDNHLFYSIMSATLATHVFFVSLFLGVIIFNNVSVCLYFWIILGFTSKINGLMLGNESRFSIESIINKMHKKIQNSCGDGND